MLRSIYLNPLLRALILANVTKYLQVKKSLSDHGDLDHVKAVGRIAFFRDSYALEQKKLDKTRLS